MSTVATSADELSRIVVDQADRLFAGSVTKERLADADAGNWPTRIWDATEQAGLPLALVAEGAGGIGLPAVDAFRLIRRAGYYTAPIPLAETMLAAAVWSETNGNALEGTISIAPVAASDAVRIAQRGSSFVLDGVVHRIPWGGDVQHILVFARDDRESGYLALVARNQLKVERRRNLANEPRDALDLGGAVPDVVQAAPEGFDGFLSLGALMRAQQMVGAMERCLDYALTYAMERKQFGRAIGKFQAIQLMLAEAAGEFAAASAAADLAAEAYGTPDLDFAVAVAKARVGEASSKVAEVCHQVHGAMGFTQEHPLHFATRRLWSWRDEFGNDAFWQERLGRLICARGGNALWPILTDE